MQPFAFERDPYCRSMEARLAGSGHDARGNYLLLEDSIFYPEGGGQPADRGRIGDFEVVHVQTVDGELRHYLGTGGDAGQPDRLQRLEAGQSLRLELDWNRRFDHMQQHSAQHLLSAIAEDRFGYPTQAFHLGTSLSDVELDVPSLGAAQLETLEAALAACIRQAIPIRARRVSPEALDQIGVRSRGLPEGHQGSVRLVEIDGLDRCTCGGTHLSSTAEIEGLKLLHTLPMRGGTRLYFVAGERLRTRLQTQEDRVNELRKLVGAPEDELSAEVERRLIAAKENELRLRNLEKRLARVTARDIQGEPGQACLAVLPEGGMAFLQAVAKHLDPEGAPTLLLSGEEGEGAFLFMAASAGGRARWDLRRDGAKLAQILDGRGGGKGNLFQGKAGKLEEAPHALRWLQERLTKLDPDPHEASS